MSESESENVKMRDISILNTMRNIVRERINQISTSQYDLLPQTNEILELIKGSVEFRQSNSVIVCGPPGCGKTTLIEHALEELKRTEVINEKTASVVRLNGLLHTDDRLALKDVMRQLNIVEGFNSSKFSTFQENLVNLFVKLKEKVDGNQSQPCIICVLDEFHLFCNHKNQILLYNLFDIVQSSKAPICVIGSTYYTDITDLMEKRVLSRFSHRIIWMNQQDCVTKRLEMFKNIFILKPTDLSNIEKIYKLLWNSRIDSLVENSQVVETLKRFLETFPGLHDFKNFMLKLLNLVTFEKPLLSIQSVKQASTHLDYYTLILGSLSILEMGLVIAVKHQTITYDRESFSFEMVYSQFLKFCNRYSTTLVTERSVVLKGFQRLEELEIIVPVRKTPENGLGKVPLEYRLYNFNLTTEQVSEGAKLNAELTTDLKQWLTLNSE